MTITATQVADTLRLLVPGFIVMKLFYQFGLQTKRSDAQWVVWSILAAVPVNAAADALYPRADLIHTGLVLVLAAAGAAVLVSLWRLAVRMRPGLEVGFTIRAWDNLFIGQASWLQVETKDGRVISGWPKYAAKSTDTDDLDVYLTAVRYVERGGYVELPGVTGILIARSQIAYISVMGAGGEPGRDDIRANVTNAPDS